MLKERIKDLWRASDVYNALVEFAQSKRPPQEDIVMSEEDYESLELADIDDVEIILDSISLYRVEVKSTGSMDATVFFFLTSTSISRTPVERPYQGGKQDPVHHGL